MIIGAYNGYTNHIPRLYSGYEYNDLVLRRSRTHVRTSSACMWMGEHAVAARPPALWVRASAVTIVKYKYVQSCRGIRFIPCAYYCKLVAAGVTCVGDGAAGSPVRTRRQGSSGGGIGKRCGAARADRVEAGGVRGRLRRGELWAVRRVAGAQSARRWKLLWRVYGGRWRDWCLPSPMWPWRVAVVTGTLPGEPVVLRAPRRPAV